MLMTRMKMKKECITARIDADTAVTIFLSSENRPKSRITRQARISRTCPGVSSLALWLCPSLLSPYLPLPLTHPLCRSLSLSSSPCLALCPSVYISVSCPAAPPHPTPNILPFIPYPCNQKIGERAEARSEATAQHPANLSGHSFLPHPKPRPPRHCSLPSPAPASRGSQAGRGRRRTWPPPPRPACPAATGAQRAQQAPSARALSSPAAQP
jgi:hypothetical protein